MMIHAAGLSWPCSSGDFSSKLLEKMLQINAIAFGDIASWAINQFDGAVGGHIVAVSSSATLHPGQEHMLIAASKACLEQLVRCYAAAYIRKKVTVNGVLPGAMASAGGDVYRRAVARISGKSMAKILEERFKSLPSDSLISPVEVADAVVSFLVQPGFSRTGNLLRVCGAKF
jgi:NAD(P)-dependent dehydrogenase (short-subunit alcohol dehydrogenase family)